MVRWPFQKKRSCTVANKWYFTTLYWSLVEQIFKLTRINCLHHKEVVSDQQRYSVTALDGRVLSYALSVYYGRLMVGGWTWSTSRVLIVCTSDDTFQAVWLNRNAIFIGVDECLGPLQKFNIWMFWDQSKSQLPDQSRMTPKSLKKKVASLL